VAGKEGDSYQLFVPCLPPYALNHVPAHELAESVFAEVAGTFIKLKPEELRRVGISEDEVGLFSTFNSLRNKLDETGRVADDEAVMSLAELVNAGKSFPGDALKKLDAISEQVTEEFVEEESPADNDADDEPVTAKTLKKILAEQNKPSFKGKSPLDMTPGELKEFKEDDRKRAIERDQKEHDENLKTLPAKKTKEELDASDPSPFAKGETPISKNIYDMNPKELAEFRQSHMPPQI
jgi:hypothetical protein